MEFGPKKFDHMAAVTNFIIIPLTFLSGTFYTIDRLPEFWQFFSELESFFLYYRWIQIWIFRNKRWQYKGWIFSLRLEQHFFLDINN